MAQAEYQSHRRRKKSWLGKVLLWCVGIFVVLVVAVAIATPWILRTAVPDIFARFAMQASVTGGSLNLLRRELTLNGFVLGGPDTQALSVGELGVGLSVRALIDGRIKLRHIRVKNISLNAERLLALRQLDDSGSVSRQGSLPVELDELALEDVRLVSSGERIGQDVRIVRLDVGDLSGFLAGRQTKVDLQGAIGEGKVNLQVDVGRDQGELRVTGKYQIDKVPVRGWARLVSQDSDPVSEGLLNGRGDIQLSYAFEARKLQVTLNGGVKLAGLGVDVEALKATHGDAEWQGRLAIQWSPHPGMLTLRGDGSVDVESLRLLYSGADQPAINAAISDISWQGDFDWRDGFSSEGAVLGTKVAVTGGLPSAPGWRGDAEDFSWRLQVQADPESGKHGARLHDIDLARFSFAVSDAAAPVDIVVEKLAVDELRGAQSGDLAIGRATVDTLTVTASGGAKAADPAIYRIDGLAASGLSGDFSGTLQAVHVSAESLDYGQSARRLRVEEVELASAGFRLPVWVGVGELKVKSARADEGKGDVWLSGLKATNAHGGVDGGFGADTIDLTHVFQSGLNDLSWEFSGLALRGLQGDTDDAARVSAMHLRELKLGVGETSWLASGLRSTDVAAAFDGNLSAASFGLKQLEHHQPRVGKILVTALDASHVRFRDARAEVDSVNVAAVGYDLPGGDVFALHDLDARGLAGDLARGLQAKHFSVARGDGRFVGGARLSAAKLVTRGLSVTPDGGVAVAQGTLMGISRSKTAGAELDLDGLDVAVLRWTPGGPLSADEAALEAARFAPAGGPTWTLAKLATRKLDWDGGARIKAESAMLAAATQMRGNKRDWRAQLLRANGFQWVQPGDVRAASLSAQSVDGAVRTIVWKLSSVNVAGLRSSPGDGQAVDSLETGVLDVSDTRNGALLTIQRTAIEVVRINSLLDLSAERMRLNRLQLRSNRPDWLSRLTLANLQMTKPRRRFDGVLDLGHVVVRDPYLIVAQTKDNAWMLPPMPGVANDAPHADKADGVAPSHGGVRLASFSTRGPGRIAYIDRGTDPAIHLSMDPVVVAIENVDTLLPGNVSRIRARGTGSRFAEFRLDGKLRKRAAGFDIDLKLIVNGAYLPDFNPYIARHESLAVTAGRVDAASDIRIEDEELSGQVKVLLSGLDVVSTTGSTVFKRIDPANFPIRTALALLRDRQGNISVTVPLEGQTEEADFDFIDNLQKDFVESLTTAGQVAANVPGKTLDRTVRLFEDTVSLLPGVSTERYLPVQFADGADGFTAEPLVYLDRLGKHMVDRKALVLALCGRAVNRDGATDSAPPASIDALFAEASKGIYPVFEPGRDGLLALAEARADAVRRYLRNLHGIPKGRLSVCEAQVDEAGGAKARVDLQVKTPAKSKGLFGLFP
jgi:hypothetical protein